MDLINTPREESDLALFPWSPIMIRGAQTDRQATELPREGEGTSSEFPMRSKRPCNAPKRGKGPKKKLRTSHPSKGLEKEASS